MANRRHRFGEKRKAGRPEAISDELHRRLKKEIFRDYKETFRLLAAYDRGEVSLSDLK